MSTGQTIDNRLAEAFGKSAEVELSFAPQYHEQYGDGDLAGAWYQCLWTRHVDQRDIGAEKQAIHAAGGFVIAVGRNV